MNILKDKFKKGDKNKEKKPEKQPEKSSKEDTPIDEYGDEARKMLSNLSNKYDIDLDLDENGDKASVSSAGSSSKSKLTEDETDTDAASTTDDEKQKVDKEDDKKRADRLIQNLNRQPTAPTAPTATGSSMGPIPYEPSIASTTAAPQASAAMGLTNRLNTLQTQIPTTMPTQQRYLTNIPTSVPSIAGSSINVPGGLYPTRQPNPLTTAGAGSLTPSSYLNQQQNTFEDPTIEMLTRLQSTVEDLRLKMSQFSTQLDRISTNLGVNVPTDISLKPNLYRPTLGRGLNAPSDASASTFGSSIQKPYSTISTSKTLPNRAFNAYNGFSTGASASKLPASAGIPPLRSTTSGLGTAGGLTGLSTAGARGTRATMPTPTGAGTGTGFTAIANQTGTTPRTLQTPTTAQPRSSLTSSALQQMQRNRMGMRSTGATTAMNTASKIPTTPGQMPTF